MKNLLIIALLTVFNCNCFSQIKFENGYFISNEGAKTLCLIKNIDWKNNPVGFIYKVSENSAPQTATITNVSEFGVFDYSKYQRFDVDIDRSSEDINKFSDNELPEFTREQLFLKVLAEGKATLFLYEANNLVKFFYSTDSLKTEQLIFKSYVDSLTSIGENNTFRNQLWVNLKCASVKLKRIEKIKYSRSDLINLFTDYNVCKNSVSINFEKKQKRDAFNLTIRPGINSSNLTLRNEYLYPAKTVFENKLNLRFGIEAEFVLGFNKNKWALLVEPAFQYFKSTSKVVENKTMAVDYKSIEFSTGLRHYFFLNDQSKIFVNVLYIYDFPISSTLQSDKYNILKIKSRENGALGVGYKHQNKYSVEFKYGLSRQILSDYILYNTQYKTVSLIFGYTIF